MTGPGPISVWRARPNELAWHYAIRQRVFVEEQGALVFTDIDRWDHHPGVQHVLAAKGPQVAGAVRLYPLDHDGRWKGDRLAVLPEHRTAMVGAQLVRFAVWQASEAGGGQMEARIQPANVAFFEWLGWSRNGPIEIYLGLPHQPMMIELADPITCRHSAPPAAPQFRLDPTVDAPRPILAGSPR